LITFTDEGHGLRQPGHNSQALAAELDYLRRNLPRWAYAGEALESLGVESA